MLIRVSVDDVITDVRVVTGEALAFLDTTGTLTQKYQARFIKGGDALEIVTSKDTDNLTPLLSTTGRLYSAQSNSFSCAVLGVVCFELWK